MCKCKKRNEDSLNNYEVSVISDMQKNGYNHNHAENANKEEYNPSKQSLVRKNSIIDQVLWIGKQD